jgi:hypothetical protein
MEIDKLEHKPVNGMALALDEARQASDKLFESLAKSNQAFTEAMGKMNVSKMQGLWQNTTPTAQADQNIAKARAGVQQVLADHQPTIDDALASGNQENVKQARESLMVDLQKAYAEQDKALRDGLTAARSAQANFKGSYSVGSDPSTVIQKYQGALQMSAQDQANAGGQYGESLLKPQKDRLEAHNAAAEAAKREQEALVQQWHKNLEEQEADYDMTLAQEAQFWVQRMESAKKGSLSYLAALSEVNRDIAKMRGENVRGHGQFDATSAGSYSIAGMDLSRGDTGAEKEQGRQSAEYIHALNEQIAAQHQAANAVAEQSLEMAVATGQMSRLDAAQVRATMHTEEFTRAQEKLQSALANAAMIPGQAGQTAVAQLNAQGTQMAGQRAIQTAQDQQAIASQQIGPAITQELGRMANDWTDMTREIVQIMTKAADSFNDDVVKAMVGKGKASDFGKTFSQAGQGLLKTSLQSLEGNVLKAFGLGSAKKADGSQGSPYYVIMAGQAGAAGGAGGSVMPFVRPFFGGQQGQGNGQGQGQQGGQPGGQGSIWGSLLHSFLPSLFKGGQQGGAGAGGGDGGGGDSDGGDAPFQGGFAGGGDFLAGRSMIVGERGPELLTPGFSGHVTPNGAGAPSGHTFNIDARGSNDPAAIHAAVMRAAPHIVAASMQAQHSSAKRSPHGK